MGQERHAKNDREHSPKPRNLWGGIIFKSVCVSLNFMLLQEFSNFAVNKVSFHCLVINNTIQGLFHARITVKAACFYLSLYLSDIFTWACTLMTMPAHIMKLSPTNLYFKDSP